MHLAASEFLTKLNTWINTNELLTLLAVAAVSGLAGWLVRRFDRRERRFGWNILYDERINQGDPSAQQGQAPADRVAQDGNSPTLSQNMWEILYQESDPQVPPYKVTNGSLLVMEMRNTGRLPIREADFGEDRDFTVRFPGRTVVHYKIRDNPKYHERVHRDATAAPRPGAGDSFTLPALLVNRGQGFKLLVLLESSGQPPPVPHAAPAIEGTIEGGRFVEYGRHPGRTRRVLIIATALAAAAAGGVIGIGFANEQLTPAPVCASGKVEIEGSTAFAPVFNEVVTEYEQYCPAAQIIVRAVGSLQGLDDLEQNTNPTPIIAMYDGLPSQAPRPRTFPGRWVSSSSP
jgi:phosphate transport system substrate-binding protein